MSDPYAANIARLEAALAKGVLTIESDGERVTYQSVTALIGAIDYMKREQAAAAVPVASQRPQTTLASYCGD